MRISWRGRGGFEGATSFVVFLDLIGIVCLVLNQGEKIKRRNDEGHSD